MKNTREKILKSSLTLFNKQGVDGVSIRDITGELNIRVGNLNYYFPSKNDIIHALCIEFIAKVDEAVLEILKFQARNLFEMAHRQVEAIFTIQLEYRFILNKRYAEITTSLPPVQQHFQKALQTRFDEFMMFHTALVNEKLARPDLTEDNSSISYILNILSLFWHQEIEIYFPEFTDQQKIRHGTSIFFHAYKPYLTAKGKKQLLPLLKKLEHY